MDYACPHCHELIRTDPASGQPPSMCPRCGGDIAIGAAARAPMEPPAHAPAASTAPAARSLAAFLQSTPPEAGATAEELPRSGADALDPGPQQAGMQTSEPTREADEVADKDHGADEVDAAEQDRPLDSGKPASTDLVDSTTEGPLATQGDALAPAATTLPASMITHEFSTTPSFTLPARVTALPPHIARWQWAALAVLALALILQVLLADRARLAAHAQWRPMLTSLCGVLGCSLPTWHEPDAFTMLSRDVRPVQGSTGALLVQATFRNDARWSQAWPVMRLSLSDADGRIVGARAFIPSEYLDAAATQTVLAPGQSAQVMLQVREPEASVVAFSFDFD